MDGRREATNVPRHSVNFAAVAAGSASDALRVFTIGLVFACGGKEWGELRRVSAGPQCALYRIFTSLGFPYLFAQSIATDSMRTKRNRTLDILRTLYGTE